MGGIMLQLIDLRSREVTEHELRELVPRAALNIGQAVEQVLPLITAVRENGEQALREQADRFDGVRDHAIRVPEATIRAAAEALPETLRTALVEMIQRVRHATRAGLPADSTAEIADGATVTQQWVPVHRVGLYVPGGKAVYPSSVVMNVVAAQEAGVTELAIASPPQRDSGGVDPVVLGVAGLLGVTEVYAMGGAGAVAAFAYGVPELELSAVDMVTGPGNIFVAAAKRVVNGTVGIDAEAGTTEIMILADDSADPVHVASDLISQAEHDEAAASVLVTTSADLVDRVQAEVRERVAKTPNRERAETALAGPQSGIILVDDTATMVEVANAYGAEHLEIHTRDAAAMVAEVRNAGAVFVGSYSPVSLGDYMAGSNHVLPTGGTARFQAGLGAHTFLRARQVVTYSKAALAAVRAPLSALAHAEGLPAHAEAVDARFEEEK